MKTSRWPGCLFAALIYFLLATGLAGPAKAESKGNGITPDRQSTVPVSVVRRALSLRVLQQKLADGQNCEDIAKMAGLTRITGYVADRDSQDIILLGEVKPDAPPLYLVDFVVALRNVFLEYAEQKGRTMYYSPPLCSIDPDPRTIARLDTIAGRIFGSSVRDTENAINSWHEVCRQPQDVVVMGLPFQSHFAAVMVKADYDMKRLVDGADHLDLPGFESLMDMTINAVKQDMRQGRASRIPATSLNRFWFHPGKNTYLEDQDSVIIDQCQVVLLTEEEYLSAGGAVKGKGRPNLFAKRFADSFSRRYAEISAKREIYAELENLFRFVALAKIIKHREVQERAGVSLDPLLKQVVLLEVTVGRQVPGRSNVKQFSMQRSFPGGVQIASILLPSCGGVGIDIKIDNNYFMKAPGSWVSEMIKQVLSSRPSPQMFYWDFEYFLAGMDS
jgi:hypothetical protein